MHENPELGSLRDLAGRFICRRRLSCEQHVRRKVPLPDTWKPASIGIACLRAGSARTRNQYAPQGNRSQTGCGTHSVCRSQLQPNKSNTSSGRGSGRRCCHTSSAGRHVAGFPILITRASSSPSPRSQKTSSGGSSPPSPTGGAPLACRRMYATTPSGHSCSSRASACVFLGARR